MKLGIMQPYLFPYIGYFQLVNFVDSLIVYDNIKYTKKGWINRNQILINGKNEYITLPLKKDSDFLTIGERNLAVTFSKEKVKLLRRISSSYSKAPYYTDVYPMIEDCINNIDDNLFSYIFYSIKQVCNYLDIKSKFTVSSKVEIDNTLKSQDKVIAYCKAMNAEWYINPIGGIQLYSHEVFNKNNIKLNFLKSENIQYKQFSNEFVPNLSIIDVLMFNSVIEINHMLNQFILI